MTIDKIIITGDMIRPSDDAIGFNQKINIDWLYNLIKFQVSKGSNLDVEVLNTQGKDALFDSKLFYKLNSLNTRPKDWISIYKNDEISEESLNYLNSFFKNSFVIGFELPEVFLKAFDKLNIVYIDIILHPIRYLDDLIFGMRTNNNSIYNGLKLFQYCEDNYYMYAQLHKATVSRMKQTKKLEPNSMLFTGQVEIDKSLINGQSLMSVNDYKNELKEISKRYNKVYVKMHPYAANNHILKDVFKDIDNTEYINDNFYYLLGQEEITAVYSISSSTVLEAKYWGKESHYLYKNPFLIDHTNTTFNSKEYVSISDNFLSTGFWNDILKELLNLDNNATIENIKIPQKSNRLRNSIQNYWGYNFLDSDILFKTYGIEEEVNTVEDKTVAQILKELEPKIKQKRATLDKKTTKTKYDMYKSSRYFYKIQSLKKIPILGKLLLVFKHKILKWE